MSTLLLVLHTPTAATRVLGDQLAAGAQDDAIEGVDVRVLSPDATTADDVLAADGLVLLCPANFGYLATREVSLRSTRSRSERSET